MKLKEILKRSYLGIRLQLSEIKIQILKLAEYANKKHFAKTKGFERQTS